MQRKYTAGEFYDKYCLQIPKDTSSVIKKESPCIISIIKEYCRILKLLRRENKRADYEVGENYNSQALESMVKDIENDPDGFTEGLKKAGEDEKFLRYITIFDKRNEEHQKVTEIIKEFEQKEFSMKALGLITGVLFVLLLQHLLIYFL